VNPSVALMTALARTSPESVVTALGAMDIAAVCS